MIFCFPLRIVYRKSINIASQYKEKIQAGEEIGMVRKETGGISLQFDWIDTTNRVC